MAGKGRKAPHNVEEEVELKGEPSGDMQAMMKMFFESNERAEARRREEKIAEEERIEARRIAAEERAEERAEAKRLRKLEEVRVAEEREHAREEAARIASEKLREQQEAINARAYMTNR